MADDLARFMADVERRLSGLEKARRATLTDVRGGSIRLVREDGTGAAVLLGSHDGAEAGIWLIGANDDNYAYLGTSGAHTLIDADNPDGTSRVFQIATGQMRFPIISTAFQKDPYVEQDSHGWARTNATDYTTCWRGVLPITTGHVFGVVDVAPDLGATLDVRIGVANFFDPVELLVVAEMTGLTAQDLLADTWAVPDGLRGTPGESSVGGTAEVMIQVRRSAGSGYVAVAPRLPLTAIVL